MDHCEEHLVTTDSPQATSAPWGPWIALGLAVVVGHAVCMSVLNAPLTEMEAGLGYGAWHITHGGPILLHTSQGGVPLGLLPELLSALLAGLHEPSALAIRAISLASLLVLLVAAGSLTYSTTGSSRLSILMVGLTGIEPWLFLTAITGNPFIVEAALLASFAATAVHSWKSWSWRTTAAAGCLILLLGLSGGSGPAFALLAAAVPIAARKTPMPASLLILVAAVAPLILAFSAAHGTLGLLPLLIGSAVASPPSFLLHAAQYLSPDFLFIHGGPDLLYSTGGSGVLYAYDIVPLLLGIAVWMASSRARILSWPLVGTVTALLIASLAASPTSAGLSLPALPFVVPLLACGWKEISSFLARIPRGAARVTVLVVAATLPVSYVMYALATYPGIAAQVTTPSQPALASYLAAQARITSVYVEPSAPLSLLQAAYAFRPANLSDASFHKAGMQFISSGASIPRHGLLVLPGAAAPPKGSSLLTTFDDFIGVPERWNTASIWPWPAGTIQEDSIYVLPGGAS